MTKEEIKLYVKTIPATELADWAGVLLARIVQDWGRAKAMSVLGSLMMKMGHE